MRERLRVALSPDESQRMRSAAAATNIAEAGIDEPIMRADGGKQPQSRSIKCTEDDAIITRGKGIPLSTVVAAYDGECECKTAQQEGTEVMAGSRGSSQTRTELCENDLLERKGS